MRIYEVSSSGQGMPNLTVGCKDFLCSYANSASRWAAGKIVQAGGYFIVELPDDVGAAF
jgi:hypothetical protein